MHQYGGPALHMVQNRGDVPSAQKYIGRKDTSGSLCIWWAIGSVSLGPCCAAAMSIVKSIAFHGAHYTDASCAMTWWYYSIRHVLRPVCRWQMNLSPYLLVFSKFLHILDSHPVQSCRVEFEDVQRFREEETFIRTEQSRYCYRRFVRSSAVSLKGR